MKAIKVFLPVESATVGTSGFMDELKQLLPNFSFHEDYDTNENPFIIQSTLPEKTSAILVSLKRRDLLTLTTMAISLKMPIFFLYEEKGADLTMDKQYFLCSLFETKNLSIFLTPEVSCEKNQGTQKLTEQIQKNVSR